MSGRIPKHFIDDLLARTDVVDLIDGYVPLRKAGSNYQANCPFHDEKTPSFTVSQDKQFYHCFGCGANGTAIGFLMEYNQLDFISAVEELANRAGLDVPREGGGDFKKDGEITEYYELLEMVVQFYRQQLKEHPQGSRAIDYLKQRGIPGELAAKMELGYAPAGWDSLINALGKSDQAKQRLLKTGMLIQRDSGGFYDRFRDRIMYPIRDQRGRAIAFGGRIIDDGTPKYLNSPETPVFHKGRELYGLYQAKRADKKIQRLYVVEGYMDVLALIQHGISNAAATLGTAATSAHLETIFRQIPQVVFCFDGDEAGRKAAKRAMETALPLLRDGREAYFRFLPQGEDPDDYIRANGKEAFLANDNLLPLSEYLIKEISADFNPAIREDKSRLIYKSTPLIRKLPHGSLKQILITRLERMTDIDEDKISRMMHGENINQSLSKTKEKPASRQERKLLSQTIKLLLQEPNLALNIKRFEELKELEKEGTNFLLEMIKLIRQNPDINCARIIEHWRGTKYEERLMELAQSGQSRYAADETVFQTREFLETEFFDAISQLIEQQKSQRKVKSAMNKELNQMTDDEKAPFRGGKHIIKHAQE